MQNSSIAKARNPLLFCVVILGLMMALVILPLQFQTEAGRQKGLITRTESHVPGLENFDIREDTGKSSSEQLMRFREAAGKDAAAVADIRQEFVRGEEALRQRVPTLKVEYSTNLRSPQVISPDVWKADIERLTSPSSARRAEILRNFIKENNGLVGVSDQQADGLRVSADYTNPSGYLSFAHLDQIINGIPVYRGEIKAGFTKSGEMIRVLNDLAPGIDYSSVSTEFGDPLNAVRRAFGYINAEPTKLDVLRNEAASSDLKVVFGNGDWATTAEKMYFPTEIGVARPSWRVLIWQPVNAFYVIVDAETGIMLSRENISADQTQPASYQIYGNPNGFIDSAESPAPLTPGPTDPTLGTQAAVIARTMRMLIGNEGPNPGANNLGWMTDGTNITDGNNVEAGIDRDGTNGVDAPQAGDGPCPGAGCRLFTSTWNPPPGNPAPGDDPLTAQAQRGAVIQMFYVMNLYHDVLYGLGFTEQARNFQNDNFGRGGVAADRVSAEGQDSSGTNNANFATPADGGRGRMQMFVWTGPTPDYDGTTDADVIIHEVSHGLSNRLHNGLGNQGGMMGEGWGDWYAHTLLAEPTDPINGIYTTGGYATYLLTSATDTSNYYYGIRKFPKAVIGFTGGPPRAACGDQPCPHNPLTFRHLNSDCFTTIGTTTNAIISAFPRGPVGSATCSQVHNVGEIWSSALWEVRGLMVTRLGFNAGTRRVLQVVTDGMKLAPGNPMILQERDAIIAAASALPVAPEASADVVDVREGFRRRGMGFSAQTITTTSVVEAFDFPNIQVVDPFSVSDAPGNNNGFPEPAESVNLTVSVTNTTGQAITNVVVNANGGTNVNVGTVNDGQTVPVQIPFTVPSETACGSLYQVMINAASDAGAQAPKSFTFRVGVPVGGAPATFTNSTPINLPNGQPTTTSGPGSPYPSAISVAGLSGNKLIKVSFNQISHTFPGDLDFLLVGPGGQKYIFASDSGGSGDVTNLDISFSDGAVAQPSTSQWVAGNFKPYNSGANDPFDAPAPAGPYANAAPAAADTFLSVFGSDGSTMNGDWTLYVDDDAGGDFGVMNGGWSITFESDDYTCGPAVSTSPRADFDGDGKTDLSIFRGSEGNWYLQRSTAGFQVLNWGLAADVLTPGDFDGDNKTDTAVFRATADSAQPDFYILNSNGFTLTGASWGVAGDIPVVRDYDGDGKADVAVFRPSNSTWYVIKSSGGTAIDVYGQAGDVPVAGDFDGDGKGDLTVYRAGTWLSQLSGGGSSSVALGSAGDFLVPADYDGDSKDDVAVFRPSTGEWFVVKSSDSTTVITTWGASGDVPVPGDYDGDGKDDYAIYRNGQWWLKQSTSGDAVSNFGLATDKAIPRAYVP